MNAKEDTHGWTALIYAIWNGNSDTIEILLDRGADPRLRDKDNRTPITHARIVGDSFVSDMLKKSPAKN